MHAFLKLDFRKDFFFLFNFEDTHRKHSFNAIWQGGPKFIKIDINFYLEGQVPFPIQETLI